MADSGPQMAIFWFKLAWWAQEKHHNLGFSDGTELRFGTEVCNNMWNNNVKEKFKI